MATDLGRVIPILVFLASITVVAELADIAGVFRAATQFAAKVGQGSIRRLWLIIVVIASLTTIFLSLDTTAVLLTPVILVLAKRLKINPWPFALTTIWLANTASLLLPVSNLTNLLLVSKLHWTTITFLHRMWIPALVALGTTVIVLGLMFKGSLTGTYSYEPIAKSTDRILFRTAAGVCIAVGPLFVIGLPPWLVGVIAAILLTSLFLWRKPRALSWKFIPWRLVVITTGLFLIVGTLEKFGLDHLLGGLVGSGQSFFSLLRLSSLAALASNTINNLPAYMAFEPLASNSSDRMLALLVGTNLGPLITIWGSLATLLWRDRCRSAGVKISTRQFVLSGIIGLPFLLILTTAAIFAGR